MSRDSVGAVLTTRRGRRDLPDGFVVTRVEQRLDGEAEALLYRAECWHLCTFFEGALEHGDRERWILEGSTN